MKKLLLIISLLTFISCEQITPQNIRQVNPICGESASLCMSTYKYIINYNTSNLNNKISLQIFGDTYLDECSPSSSDIFKVTPNSTTLKLETLNNALPEPGVNFLDIKILDCSDQNSQTNVIYQNKNVNFIQDRLLKIITVNL